MCVNGESSDNRPITDKVPGPQFCEEDSMTDVHSERERLAEGLIRRHFVPTSDGMLSFPGLDDLVGPYLTREQIEEGAEIPEGWVLLPNSVLEVMVPRDSPDLA